VGVHLIDDRINVLRLLTFEEVKKFPESKDRDLVLDSLNYKFTEFMQRLAGGEILLTGRLSWSTGFGLLDLSTERGLVFSADRRVRDATEDEMVMNGG